MLNVLWFYILNKLVRLPRFLKKKSFYLSLQWFSCLFSNCLDFSTAVKQRRVKWYFGNVTSVYCRWSNSVRPFGDMWLCVPSLVIKAFVSISINQLKENRVIAKATDFYFFKNKKYWYKIYYLRLNTFLASYSKEHIVRSPQNVCFYCLFLASSSRCFCKWHLNKVFTVYLDTLMLLSVY